MRSLAVLLPAFLLAGCATHAVKVGKTAEGAEIFEVTLRYSNAYVIKTSPPVMVDAGADGDFEALSSALAEQGIDAKKLALVIATHGHFDHAGLGAELQRNGAKIMIGAPDAALARTGKSGDVNPSNFTADTLKLVLPWDYPKFQPDIVVEGPFDLAPYGIGGQVLPMPGHTRGSLVVVLQNQTAFVGDQMLGGVLGGAGCPDRPGEHYFQADYAQNRRNIRALVRMGIETFYLGHGGPVKRDAVMDEFGF